MASSDRCSKSRRWCLLGWLCLLPVLLDGLHLVGTVSPFGLTLWGVSADDTLVFEATSFSSSQAAHAIAWAGRKRVRSTTLVLVDPQSGAFDSVRELFVSTPSFW